MKRYGNLYGDVSSFHALLSASIRARKNKRFKAATQEFEFDLEKNLIELEAELKAETWRPGPCREFYICEPKRRKISAAPYRDRVVHHALHYVLEPIFDGSFIFDTYACRIGKGTHAAVDRFTAFSRKHPYVLKCDIRKYFPSIDHEILKQKIRRKIKCEKTLRLTDLIIDSSNRQDDAFFHFPGDEPMTPWFRPKGIPIGNLTSQLFANLYLSDLDHYIQKSFSRFKYLRYMDDLTFFGNDKADLWSIIPRLEARLANDRLKLHPNKRMLYPVDRGVSYLGYKIWPDHRRVQRASAVRYGRKLRRLQKKYQKGDICLDDVRASVHSWIGHVQHADSWGLRRALLGAIPFQQGAGRKRLPCAAGRLLV